jgi:periplasmic protein TonB
MSPEQETGSEVCLGSFCGCLVEADLEQRVRERRIRRRALTISILAQGTILAALVIVPLFAKTPQISVESFVPIPPYYHNPGPSKPATEPRPKTNSAQKHCEICAPAHIPPTIPILHSEATSEPHVPDGGIDLGPGATGHGRLDGLNIFDSRRQPPPPVEPQGARNRRVRIGTLQPAMLLHRVEPAYPPLMRQIRKSGRVELRAIISTDGTIESLQVLSGDPGFFLSALDAVRQWRYKPTILNGQAVEVETNISVIYTMQ